jgi:hypothetical protein
MNYRLRTDLDVPIRIGLWAVVIVGGEPAKGSLDGAGTSGLPRSLGPGAAMTFQIFSHGAAVLLTGLGPLPGDLAEAVPYVTLRLGGLLLGLGVAVTAILYVRTRPCRPANAHPAHV